MSGGVSVGSALGVQRQGPDGQASELLVTPPPTAVYMRCCGTWEEYDESVNWSTLEGPGYLHWSRAECRL